MWKPCLQGREIELDRIYAPEQGSLSRTEAVFLGKEAWISRRQTPRAKSLKWEPGRNASGEGRTLVGE